jgi:hypothetical protein
MAGTDDWKTETVVPDMHTSQHVRLAFAVDPLTVFFGKPLDAVSIGVWMIPTSRVLDALRLPP